MEVFNDWQMMGEDNQNLAQKEFAKISKSEIYATKQSDFSKEIFDKIAYLKSLLPILKQHNSNSDVRFVLNGIEKNIDEQVKLLHTVFETFAGIFSTEIIETKIFCNNLKLSIQTCLEIINLLSKQNVKFGNNKIVEKILENFVDICQKYTSLFGECQYRIFTNKYEK